MNPAENEVCPHCGAPAIDITRYDDPGKRWLCIGVGAHEWNEGDIFDEPDDSERQPSFAKRLIHKFSF